MAGGRNRSKSQRRARRAFISEVVEVDDYGDVYPYDGASFYGDADESVLGMRRWKTVACTPAAIPSSQPTGQRNGGDGGGQSARNNSDAVYRRSAARREPRAELREMPYTRDGRPAVTTCAKRQSDMFAEMVAYTRYDRDEINFEVWVAELFADFMIACEAEVRRCSQKKEELVVWMLRAALMADAYDISMFHICFCPLGACKEFRETRDLLHLHIVEDHPTSKQAKQLRREGFLGLESVGKEVAYTTQPSPSPAAAVPRATALSPTAQRDQLVDAATEASFGAVQEQLRLQLDSLRQYRHQIEKLLLQPVDELLRRQLTSRGNELVNMEEYVRRQQNELIYEKTMALLRKKPEAAVAEVLAQMQRVVGDQARIIQSLLFAAAAAA